ncbi:MAG: hypothetical protein EZS28_034207 [Streblomastix strix]|uniref:Uncharacterized protein n=1 Tax=Streblomastix strix TaxID=222440 RepID=A0A5J4UII2_9EUKA|nr:MAG: hypothetical protein EZS28_034207 [Streblomastix strix]
MLEWGMQRLAEEMRPRQPEMELKDNALFILGPASVAQYSSSFGLRTDVNTRGGITSSTTTYAAPPGVSVGADKISLSPENQSGKRIEKRTVKITFKKAGLSMQIDLCRIADDNEQNALQKRKRTRKEAEIDDKSNNRDSRSHRGERHNRKEDRDEDDSDHSNAHSGDEDEESASDSDNSKRKKHHYSHRDDNHHRHITNRKESNRGSSQQKYEESSRMRDRRTQQNAHYNYQHSLMHGKQEIFREVNPDEIQLPSEQILFGRGSQSMEGGLSSLPSLRDILTDLRDIINVDKLQQASYAPFQGQQTGQRSAVLLSKIIEIPGSDETETELDFLKKIGQEPNTTHSIPLIQAFKTLRCFIPYFHKSHEILEKKTNVLSLIERFFVSKR